MIVAAIDLEPNRGLILSSSYENLLPNILHDNAIYNTGRVMHVIISRVTLKGMFGIALFTSDLATIRNDPDCGQLSISLKCFLK